MLFLLVSVSFFIEKLIKNLVFLFLLCFIQLLLKCASEAIFVCWCLLDPVTASVSCWFMGF